MVAPLLAALQGRNASAPPVWLMRQAGRYMPSYRALRERYTFLEMVHNSELAATVTLMPIEQLDVDAAILFSDILLIIEALGVGLHFDEGIGPIIGNPVREKADVDALVYPQIYEKLAFVAKAIKEVKPQLNVPLIGFCGGPFTLASYLIEGKSSRDLKITKRWMLSDPDSFHQLLQLLTDLTIQLIEMQIDAGVDVIQIFDSWAGVLSYRHFVEFCLPYLEKLSSVVKAKERPVILFCRGSSTFAPQLASLAPTAISLDWHCDIASMRKTIGRNIALQGNLDPQVLHAPKNVLEAEVAFMLQGMKGDQGYIFNLGHGVLPDTPYSNVQTLVDIVKNA